MGNTFQNNMIMLRGELHKARTENTKANKEYESLKGEVIKVVQGQSTFSMDLLSELVESARNKVITTSGQVTTLTVELEDSNAKIEEMHTEYNRIISWSEIFDESDIEVKKMMVCYIIKMVMVLSGYDVHFEFNLGVQQFLQGVVR